jgi:hypothetical protein
VLVKRFKVTISKLEKCLFTKDIASRRLPTLQKCAGVKDWHQIAITLLQKTYVQ